MVIRACFQMQGGGHDRDSSGSRDSVPGITGQGWGGAAIALLAKDSFLRFSWPKDRLNLFGLSFHQTALYLRVEGEGHMVHTPHLHKCPASCVPQGSIVQEPRN